MWREILLTVCLLSGCAAPSTLEYGYVGSPEGYAQAQEAAHAWNWACGGMLVVVHWGVSDGLVPLEETEVPPEPGDLGMTYRVHTLRGWGPTGTRFVRGAGAGVVAHEFGHGLGLEHQASGVMLSGFRVLRPGSVRPEDCAAVLGQ